MSEVYKKMYKTTTILLGACFIFVLGACNSKEEVIENIVLESVKDSLFNIDVLKKVNEYKQKDLAKYHENFTKFKDSIVKEYSLKSDSLIKQAITKAIGIYKKRNSKIHHEKIILLRDSITKEYKLKKKFFLNEAINSYKKKIQQDYNSKLLALKDSIILDNQRKTKKKLPSKFIERKRELDNNINRKKILTPNVYKNSLSLGLSLDVNDNLRNNNHKNLTLEVEKLYRKIYFRGELGYLKTVKNYSYTNISFATGFHFSLLNIGEEFYIGLRGGGLYRREKLFHTIGSELGLSMKINNRLFIGLRTTWDYRADLKIWNDPKYVNSNFLKFGWIL